jgi:uncharacterized protein (UPF0332 family)
MNWDWNEYLRIARNLAKGEIEAADRSAISRAYYGAFNLARRWLEAHDLPIEDHRAHGQVWKAFKVAVPATPDTREKWQEIGVLGGYLRQLRNLADYADEVPGVKSEAVKAVDTAERILGLLPELKLAD